MYGFHKICEGRDTGEMSYHHPYFQRGRKDLLQQVIRVSKRKATRVQNEEITQEVSLSENEEMSRKSVKVSDTESIKARTTESQIEAGLSNFENEFTNMQEKALYFIMKYGEFSKEKREASHVQSENDLRLEFDEFRNEVFSLLEFDKIDSEYPEMERRAFDG